MNKLSRRLSRKVAEEYADGSDLFTTTTVIVPNYNIAAWLKLQIAATIGLTINIRFEYLEQGFRGVLEQLSSNSRLMPLPRSLLELAILQQLLDAGRQDQKLAALTTYLGPIESGDFCRKIWQLSRKLARLFVEYEYHREEIISSWQRGEDVFVDTVDELQIESCQRMLYQRLFASGVSAFRRASDDALATLPRFARAVLSSSVRRPPRSRPIHLFAFSHLSPFHQRLVYELGNFFDIFIYHFNLCAEYWEDVNTEWEDRRAQPRNSDSDASLDVNEPENELLKAWGRPGREMVRFLGSLEERCLDQYPFDCEWLVDEIDAEECVLSLVRHQILHRCRDARRLPQDRSLQIAACPSRYREVESVFHSIIYNLQENKELRLNDIAIYVTDFDGYYPVIRAVFDGCDRFSYCFVDLNDALESLYAKAAIQLLSLSYCPFTRKELFSLFRNPCFRAAAGLSEEDVNTWLQWAHRLNIIRGFSDINDEKIEFSASAPFTWLLALKRLRLGQLMGDADHSPAAGFDREFAGLSPYEDFASQNRQLLDRFTLTVELLACEVDNLRTKRNAGQWRHILTNFFQQFLSVPENHPEEELTRRNLIDSLNQLQFLDVDNPDRNLELKLIVEYLQTGLRGYPSPSTNFSRHGVSVASLRPMRPLSFKHIYILGLDENDFPGSPHMDRLDLRGYAKKPSDLTVPEVNLYLFLETLMCAREKLFLSYISRDLQKDHPRHASSVIHVLTRYLNENVLTAPFRLTEVPLSVRSPIYLDNRVAYTDRLYNFNPIDRIMSLWELTHTGACGEHERRQQAETLMARYQIEFDLKFDDCAKSDSHPVSINTLALFLENPVRVGARFQLGFFEDDETSLQHLEDEPNFTHFRTLKEIVENVIRQFLIHPCHRHGLSDYFHDLYDHYAKMSFTPMGSFQEIDRAGVHDKMLERIYGGQGINGALTELAEHARDSELLENVSFGPFPKPCPCIIEPLRFEFGDTAGGDAVVYELYGSVPLIWRDRAGMFTDALVITNSREREGSFPKSIFPAFIFYVCALAAGRIRSGAAFRIHLSHARGLHSYLYSKLTQQSAARYLRMLLYGIQSDDAYDLLPYAVVTKTKRLMRPIASHPPAAKDDYAFELENAVLQETNNPYSSYYLTEFEKLLDPKVPANAYDKVRQRFRPLYHSHKMLLPGAAGLTADVGYDFSTLT